jgi:hypothetical protein
MAPDENNSCKPRLRDMKTNETQKMKPDEAAFGATLVVVLLLVVPMLGEHQGKYGGGIAMVTVSVIGLIAYFFLFGERLRNRGQLTMVKLVLAASFALGAAVAAALWLIGRVRG